MGAIAIHGCFYREEEPGGTLDFIDDNRSRKACDEARRIGMCGRECCVIVQCQVAARRRLGQRIVRACSCQSDGRR